MHTHHKRVLFICKRRNESYGASDGNYNTASYGLLNSCRLVGKALMSTYPGLQFHVAIVDDNNGIDREVYNYRPTHVIIEALWVVPDKFDVLLPRYPRTKWSVRLHSKAAFIANEGVAFEWIKGYERLKTKYNNFNFSVNDKDFHADLSELLDSEIDYLPNLYPIGDGPKHRCPDLEDKELHIGCFGAIRPLKNQLEQAIAAIIFADEMEMKLHFHINAARTEQRGDNVLKNIRALFSDTKHVLVEHKWYGHDDFIEVVRKMDIGMQVSFSETFNIVAADFAANNVPVIVSPEIDWASMLYKVDPNDTDKIVRKLKFAYAFSCVNLHYLNKAGLNRHNARSIQAWGRYLFHNKRD